MKRSLFVIFLFSSVFSLAQSHCDERVKLSEKGCDGVGNPYFRVLCKSTALSGISENKHIKEIAIESCRKTTSVEPSLQALATPSFVECLNSFAKHLASVDAEFSVEVNSCNSKVECLEKKFYQKSKNDSFKDVQVIEEGNR